MGNVIKAFVVRSYRGEKPRRLRLYFDTGSAYTFVKRSACAVFKARLRLPKAEDFGGMGNGRFSAQELLHLEVRMLGVWCRHSAYVVKDEILEKMYDVLVGHDFMQKFGVTVQAWNRKRSLIVNRTVLEMAQRVRSIRDRGFCQIAREKFLLQLLMGSELRLMKSLARIIHEPPRSGDRVSQL